MKNPSLLSRRRTPALSNLAAGALTCALMTAAASAQAAPQACTDTIDVQSPVLTDGFGFDARNTRNQRSLIFSGNVNRLEVALTHVAPNYIGRRGAVAVTEQTVYMTEGPYVIARNRTSGCEYWRFSAPQGLDRRGGVHRRESCIPHQ
ncbi:MAG: hypothetical protein QM742_19525 [Aquabacterium sp.]